MAKETIPDTSMAEEWLSPDVFVFKGKKWQVKPDGIELMGESSLKDIKEEGGESVRVH